jgi:hypothetical protein
MTLLFDVLDLFVGFEDGCLLGNHRLDDGGSKNL